MLHKMGVSTGGGHVRSIQHLDEESFDSQGLRKDGPCCAEGICHKAVILDKDFKKF
jgi:hypothetical protein